MNSHYPIEDENILSRIFLEPPAIALEDIHVVNDMVPICDVHLLAILKGNFGSIADSPHMSNVIHALRNTLPQKRPDTWYFLEKGRASFCTSMNGPHRGHAHLIPSRCVHQTIVEDFCSSGTTIAYNSLEECMSDLGLHKKQYVILGSLHAAAYALTDANVEKRFLRHLLSRHAKNSIA